MTYYHFYYITGHRLDWRGSRGPSTEKGEERNSCFQTRWHGQPGGRWQQKTKKSWEEVGSFNTTSQVDAKSKQMLKKQGEEVGLHLLKCVKTQAGVVNKETMGHFSVTVINNRTFVTRVGQLGAQLTANPAVLSDILAEDRLRINTSPIYEDDVMNVMLLSGSSDGGKVLETPKSSKKKSYAGIAKKVRKSTTFDLPVEEDDVPSHPID